MNWDSRIPDILKILACFLGICYHILTFTSLMSCGKYWYIFFLSQVISLVRVEWKVPVYPMCPVHVMLTQFSKAPAWSSFGVWFELHICVWLKGVLNQCLRKPVSLIKVEVIVRLSFWVSQFNQLRLDRCGGVDVLGWRCTHKCQNWRREWQCGNTTELFGTAGAWLFQGHDTNYQENSESTWKIHAFGV